MTLWSFPKPLVKATLLRRYQRFLADVDLGDGKTVTAHCPNTGSMKSCWAPGVTVWLQHDPSPKKKLAYTWELTETDGGFIGVNTVRPNQVAQWAVENQILPELRGYGELRKEMKYGSENSRIDLWLGSGPLGDAFVEVKNTTLLVDDRVAFPDSVTERGQKHLRELMGVVEGGSRGVLLFFVNRPEGEVFTAADAIDPEYGKVLREAEAAGVELLAYRFVGTPEGYRVGAKLPIEL